MTPLRSSLITQGTQRAPNRAMLRAVGFGDGDFTKPIVGVANAFSTLTPCNLGLDVLARRAEATLRTLGVMPQLFGTITVSDGISMGTEGMKRSEEHTSELQSRLHLVCRLLLEKKTTPITPSSTLLAGLNITQAYERSPANISTLCTAISGANQGDRAAIVLCQCGLIPIS